MKINVINTPVKDFTSVNVEERIKLDVRAGDTVKVTVKIRENNKGKEKVRLQVFEGLVLSRKHGNEAGATICVRKVSKGVGVERIFPVYSPIIDKIEIVKKGGVKKSKLYYLREKVAREIRRQMRRSKLVNIATTSDIEETEMRLREAEDALKKAEEDAAAATVIEEVAEEVMEPKSEEAMEEAPEEMTETETKETMKEVSEEVMEDTPATDQGASPKKDQ